MDGPSVALHGAATEAFGIQYHPASGELVRMVGGEVAFRDSRPRVRPVSFEVEGDSCVSTVRAGDLQITTHVWVDLELSLVLVSAVLENQGSEILRDVFYSREWAVPGTQGWTFPDSDVPLAEVPSHVSRRVWMMDDMPPGRASGLTFCYEPPPSAPVGPFDLPLQEWTNATWPNGLDIGDTNGLTFGDENGDGWIDMVALESGEIWRNLGGVDWALVYDLDTILPPADRRYGAYFADYDNDGDQDLATAPRKRGLDECHHMLRNEGNTQFTDIALNPALMSEQPCGADGETICWGDVDADGDIDMFLPAYPWWAWQGPGNFFLENLGPTGPGGAYGFAERVDEVGLDNPQDSARPEGAQFADYDQDGDLDLYSNGTLYQNISEGSPRFQPLTEAASGIGLSTSKDEGASFIDYDMDGDDDLFCAYALEGVKIWESYGDGMFFEVEEGVVESPFTGLDLGLSSEDWDNDGDIDFTTREVFRRNMLMEEGQRRFRVATHDIQHYHIHSATPSWGDWDKDGDLDAAIGNWKDVGYFYENILYDEGTLEEAKRHLRVRVVRDSATVDEGLDNEFGATIEVKVHGEEGVRRKKFTASGSGYMNQNEYTRHFALPEDPFPGDPERDVVFDLVIDFPSDPAEGLWRVDRHVNPLLGSISLARLPDREITVYRSGRVRWGACDVSPTPPRSPLLRTTSPLAVPTASSPLIEPISISQPNTYCGIEFSTELAPGPIFLEELVLDGQLDDPEDCQGTSANVLLWDVTDAGSPILVRTFARTTSARNRRHFLPLALTLDAGRRYRMAAKVTSWRPSPIQPDQAGQAVQVGGAFLTPNPDPCDPAAVTNAFLAPNWVVLAIRYRAQTPGTWMTVGEGVAGATGVPQLRGSGVLRAGSTYSLEVVNGPASSPFWMFLGTDPRCAEFSDGVLIPEPMSVVPLNLDALGEWRTSGTPSTLLSGITVFFQAWIVDPFAPSQLSATNGIAGTTWFE